MPIVICKACGQKHDAMLVRCPPVGSAAARRVERVRVPITEETVRQAASPKPKPVVKTPGTGPLSGVTLVSAEHPINAGGLRGRRIKKGSLETIEIELPVADDCSNAACPYRDEVLARRRSDAVRAKAYRDRRKGKKT